MRLWTFFIYFFSMMSAVQATAWQPVSFPVQDNITGIWFTDTLRGFVITESAELYKTENAGQNWQAVVLPDLPESAAFYDLHFPTSHLGFIVGDLDSSIGLLTIDGGLSWSLVSAPEALSLRSVWFSSENIGYAVGKAGKCYKTSVGGQVWSVRNTPTSEDLTSIHFFSDQHGMAVGSNGVVLKTNSGANTWQSVSPDSNANFVAVQYLSFEWVTVAANTPQGAQLYFSQSDGFFWDGFSQPLPNVLLNDLFVVDVLHSLAIGHISNNPFIMGTPTSTNVWNQQILPDSGFILNALFALDTLNAWIGGTNGKLYKTSRFGFPPSTSILNIHPLKTSIYPNPGHDFFAIRFAEESKVLSIAIKDVQGRIIQEHSDFNKFHVFQTLEWPTGMYFIEILSEEGSMERLRWIRN